MLCSISGCPAPIPRGVGHPTLFQFARRALRCSGLAFGVVSRARFLLAFLALVAAALLLAAPASAQSEGKGVYVALGDSYTSAPLVPNQYGTPIDCGRSDRNYPSLVAQYFGSATFVDVSCGSAQTKHMTEPQTGLPAGGTNPPQFDALRRDADLVTVGIGGNDAGLVGVAEQCAQLGLLQPFGTACRDYYAPGGDDRVAARIQEAGPKVAAVIKGIHKRAPDARVAIVGYPDVLPDPEEGGCYPMVPLSNDDIRYIDELLIRINTMIRKVALNNGADYVNTYADSGGHDVCKLPPERWFEGLVPTEPAFPLHPNAKGEASMARSAIAVLEKPSRRAPRVTKLRVKPKRVRVGRTAKVKFVLDQPAAVTVTYLSKRRGVARIAGYVDRRGKAGKNKLKLKPRRLGKRPARFMLKVTATADGLQSKPAKTKFRVRGKR